ncbi:MAG: ABC transporter substrate-binding protein [Methyloversatilis discipulorum]|jgi:ABC-type nitrate/sulfonate/bicarbonate transport system substrate-binding protein|uniref:ABC transporter substrate-binding protein n=1 Tax=Methyloversatilis discipulorum TaxID=1119528 RepID=UPI0026F09557|nr:ABC transporter substrate-binding protein [Methyloversatilis discipulorum]MBT9516012.1 ABC transporter substrate-binding protein [Methyloversatilis discipulorum]
MTASTVTTPQADKLERVWFTRCPVPTATGLAYKLGWLDEEFARDNLPVSTLQENASRELARHHYDHELPGLIREGGNLLAIAARAQGAPTRLIGLTWIDEAQAILVRPDSGIRSPADLKGKRLALPRLTEFPITPTTRGRSIARAMSLAGYKGALAVAGLTFDDVKLVEVGSGGSPARETATSDPSRGLSRLWEGIADLVEGKVDAVYVKGASAVDSARAAGVVVGIDLDAFEDRRHRVNNGTPRPITVHQDTLDKHFDVVVRFLAQTLRAADWATTHLPEVREILKAETRSGDDGVAAAYRNDFHLSLHPDLSDEKVDLFRRQRDFLLAYGFLDRDFDFDAWIDRRPLEAALELLRTERKAA